MAINEFSGNMFVLQEHGYQMKEFDASGRFLKIYNLPEQLLYYFDFLDKNRLIYVASSHPGEKKYSNFKILNLKILKIENGFVPIQGPAISNAFQRFIIKDGILWTCPRDKMELVGYDMKAWKEVKHIPIEESYKEFKIIRGRNSIGNWISVMFYNFSQPLLIDRNIYVLVKKQDFKDETRESRMNPKIKKFSLYRLEKGHLNEVSDLSDYGFMDLAATWQNRIILYTSYYHFYPHIKVLEVRE